jgi:xanthine dehydrogenase accessory factor
MAASKADSKALKDLVIVIRGAGEMATGIACRLYRANFRRILMLETEFPLAVRRQVSFCEAVHERTVSVEGIEAVKVFGDDELRDAWANGRIGVRVDPRGESLRSNRPEVFIDATLAKRNLGTTMNDAALVIAMGPGFVAGEDCHLVIETNRGHDLGRLIYAGAAEANTGIPGDIGGYTKERVLRAPSDGIFASDRQIGDPVVKGDVIGWVGSDEVTAQIDGVLRGLIRPGIIAKKGLKIGDVDPRGKVGYCSTVSEKTRALGGAVLEGILAAFNR